MSDNIHIIELATYEPPKIVEDKKNDWIYNGGYYDFLLNRYRNSPTHNTIVNNIIHLINGKGLISTNASRYPNDWAQFISMLAKEDVLKICTDFYLFGKADIQCIFNDKHDKVVKMAHIESNLVMPGKCNDKGEIDYYYFSNDWKDTKKFEPKKIPAFGTSKEEIELIEIRKYSPGKKYFSDVEYQGCMNYTVLEEEVADYLITIVQQGFSGTKVINFNNGETDEEKMNELHRKVKAKFTGTKGDRVIVSFNKNQESKTTVDDLPLDNAPEYYKTLSEECTHKILRGHKVTTPLLLGISADNGFSSNSDELRNGFILFENMVIKPLQAIIIDGFDRVINYNQNRINISFSSLQPLDSSGDLTKTETTTNTVNMSQQSIGYLDMDKWELIDSRKVNYDDDHEIDELIFKANNRGLLKQAIHFVKTGSAYPMRSSEQDSDLFVSRYRYSGNVGNDSRPFCKAMLSANKLYRKEDITAMDNEVVNAGWGPNGADTYSIWLYKGGGNCHHYWTRETYRRKGTDVKSPLASQVTPSQARKEGEILPSNNNKVYQQPVDMPNNGFIKKKK